jgi:hypothetical protein
MTPIELDGEQSAAAPAARAVDITGRGKLGGQSCLGESAFTGRAVRCFTALVLRAYNGNVADS